MPSVLSGLGQPPAPAASPAPTPPAKPTGSVLAGIRTGGPGPAPAPAANPEFPGVPPGVRLRRPGDGKALRQWTFDNALEAAKSLQPVSNALYTLRLDEPHYAGPEEMSKAEYKKAILTGGSLTRRLRGTWRLIDNATGQPVSERKATIAEVPYFTDNSTAVLSGTDYSTAHQTRLKPGVFARVKSSGEAEAHVNVLPGQGRQHHLVYEPGKGVLKLHFEQTAVPLVTALRAMGVGDKQIRESLGDLYEANDKADNPQVLAKLLPKLTRKPDPLLTPAQQVATQLQAMKLDPDVSARSLGTPFDHVSPEFYLAAAKRVLEVHKGADGDDRDALENQVVMGPEDVIAERIRNAKGDLHRMLFKATLAKSVDRIPSGLLTPRVHAAIVGSGLGNPLEEVNALELLDQATRITRMGEGGIRSTDAIPMESRSVHPSHYNFVDPIRTPENLRAGVDMRLSQGVMKGSDGRLYSKFRNARTNQVEWRSPQDLAGKVLAFHDELSDPARQIVRAIRQNRLDYASPGEVDYDVPDNDEAFNHLSNLLLAKSGTANQRVAMGSRMLAQAMPLAAPQAPLVRPGPKTGPTPESGDSYHRILGELVGAVRAKKAGIVKQTEGNTVVVQNDDGTTEKHELYNWHPLNRKSFLHQTAAVRAGERVEPGRLLARSNNTDADGLVAPGTNLRTAYTVRDGNNFEDAISISESAARMLASDHMYQHGLEFDENHVRGKNNFVGAMPTKYKAEWMKQLDDDGVIAPGATVESGQPLVVAARKRDPKYGRVLRGHGATVEDASQTWERSTPGVVTDVTKTDKGVHVTVRSTVPVEVSDKIAGLYGDKSIVAEVIPDHLMPTDAEGRPFHALVNPLGIQTRGNPSQYVEALLGKVAEKTGKPYQVSDFTQGRHWMKWAVAEALKHGVAPQEDIVDVRSGKTIPRVMTGSRYFLRLHHIGEDKIQARGAHGGYDSDDQPARGKAGGAKRLSLAELYAVLSHGGYGVLKDKALRSTKNSEWWSRFMAGQDVPEPKVPTAVDKFLSYLQASGVDPVRRDTRINLMAMTDRGVDELSAGREITSDETVDWDANLKPKPGGLFDEGLTGGHDGRLWAHVKLPVPLPNPVMEEPIRRLLGLTGKQFEETIAGRHEIQGFGSGPQAIQKALAGIDLDAGIRAARADFQKRRGSGRDGAARRLKLLKSAQAAGIHPREWLLTKVPVLPPKFRPVDVIADTGRPLVADANYLYRDLLHAKQAYEGLDGRVEDLSGERSALYGALKAVVGLGDPINPKNAALGVKGILRKVFGNTPKFGYVQRRLLSSPVDLVSRSVISPDPNLGLDEVGIPEESAWGAYEPIVLRQLSRRGMPPVRALAAVRERGPDARAELLKAMASHPVIMSRAPVHHRYGVMAFLPKLMQGSSIRMNPFVTKGFGADYDGDQVNIHVPVLEEARRDAIERMLPSANLINPKDFGTHYKPINEFAGGLYEASTAKQEDVREQVFHTLQDARRAHREGRITWGTPIAILE